MARLYLFAEGQTEQTFADTTLKQHLALHGTYLQNAVLIAHARKKGRVHRGGGRNYAAIRKDIRRFTKQDRHPNAFFTTMIDLYAIPSEFPGLSEAESYRIDPIKRVAHLESSFKADIADTRFIPFIQLHEFEAYLFCGPEGFRQFYTRCEVQIARLKAVGDGYATPEMIDDNSATCPSRRICREFPDYEDAKPNIGPQVANWIGVSAIRSKCPHFDQWLTQLETLSGRAC